VGGACLASQDDLRILRNAFVVACGRRQLNEHRRIADLDLHLCRARLLRRADDARYIGLGDLSGAARHVHGTSLGCAVRATQCGTAGQDGTMSRHVPPGVAGSRGGTGTHTLGVSCPVPLSRPSVLAALAMRPLLYDKPNQLDALDFTARHHPTRLCVL